MTSRIVAVALVAAALAACGKKGPPLAPIVLTPGRPDAFVAARRGDTVHIEFVVPGANSDGSRPANVTRVDVYGFTGSAGVTDDDLMRLGRRIASVAVNEPPDPDRPEPPPAPASTRNGVDQGAIVRLTETLAGDLLTPVEIPPLARPAMAAGRPAEEPVPASPVRSYLAVPVAGRRTGLVSRRGAVPLVPAPAMPSPPTVSYDEQRVLVEWPASGDASPVAHHVYEVSQAGEQADAPDRRLTTEPATGASFEDARVEWGVRRCYVLRAVMTADAMPVESDPSPARCVEMTDTFAPPPPTGLTAVSSVGAVSLIWDATTAVDLAGYLVLKGQPGGPLAPVRPAPVAETTYRDQVPPGTRVAYAVQAVDKAGNVSAPSATVEETSR